MTEKQISKIPWWLWGWTILGAASVFPPLGIVLLWWRQGTRVIRKILLTLPILLFIPIHLLLFYGMRVEVDGTGMIPIFTFHNPKRDIVSLEKQRQKRAPEANKSLTVSAGTYWIDFRGPLRDGHYAEMPIKSSWPSGGIAPLYRQPIGGGYASFVIANGHAFTIEQRRNQEYVVAYALENGRELWSHHYSAEFQESTGGDGPRATPTWHEGKVYSLGATGEFRCLDAGTGKMIWSKNILSDNGAKNLKWGMAASPLIVDEKVIMLPGGPNASIVAYNKMTGETVWKALSDIQAYTSPMLVTLSGQRQLLIVSAERMMGIKAENGQLLWDYPWTTEYGVNASQPIVVDADHVFISAGYDHGAALLQIIHDGDLFKAREIWKNNLMKNKFSPSVLHNGHIYGLDEAILACIDAMTGQRKWKGGRYGYGQLLLAGEHLIILTEKGDLALVRALPDRYEELARFSAIDGKTWNVPAIGNGILLVRNTREMAAFRIGE